MKTTLKLLLAISLFSTTSFAQEAAGKWKELQVSCENDWSKFEKDLLALRSNLKREVASLTPKTYLKRELADDPGLNLVKVTWPADLEGKDEFWKGNTDCANLHWEVRKALASTMVDKKTANEKIQKFRDCVVTRYDHKKVIAPVDRLIACYEKRANKN